MCWPTAAKSLGKRDQLAEQHRLAAGHHDVPAIVLLHLPHDLLDRQILPSGSHDVYGVSQNQQRRLQPLVRTKTLSVPVSRPSPCSDL